MITEIDAGCVPDARKSSSSPMSEWCWRTARELAGKEGTFEVSGWPEEGLSRPLPAAYQGMRNKLRSLGADAKVMQRKGRLFVEVRR